MLVLEWLDSIMSDVTCCCMWLLVVTRFAYLLDLYTIHMVTQLIGVAVWCSLGGYDVQMKVVRMSCIFSYVTKWSDYIFLISFWMIEHSYAMYTKVCQHTKVWHFKILPPTFSIFLWGIIPFLSYQLMFHYAYLWKTPRYLCFTMFMWLFCLFTLLLLLWLLKAIWLGIIDWLTRYRGHIHI